ncbi:hypothetical protein [Burkholderia sp. SCN-KJ]|uniref:hypothetical protein n=1 Tax=Burkholderia sp. SCN-KJ TaxID=2969248 RepID=UPI00214FFBDE|nr:hypothetical protein [Burkholderia sp. SCN-KJ]MCR4470021.1 hypothetical protein [Burkholderia sp. SCN-KJ]
MTKLYRGFGKRTFAACNKRDGDNEAKIKAEIKFLLMHEEKLVEKLVIKSTTQVALERFAKQIDWPPHILTNYPDSTAKLVDAAGENFSCCEGPGETADVLVRSNEAEMPARIKEATISLEDAWPPHLPQSDNSAPADGNVHPEVNVNEPN